MYPVTCLNEKIKGLRNRLAVHVVNATEHQDNLNQMCSAPSFARGPSHLCNEYALLIIIIRDKVSYSLD